MWCVIWVDCKGLDKVRRANIAVCVCVCVRACVGRRNLSLCQHTVPVGSGSGSGTGLLPSWCTAWCILEHECMLVLGRGGMKLEGYQACTYLENKSLLGRPTCRWDNVISLRVLFNDAVNFCRNIPLVTAE
jgi:hypothetical protein